MTVRARPASSLNPVDRDTLYQRQIASLQLKLAEAIRINTGLTKMAAENDILRAELAELKKLLGQSMKGKKPKDEFTDGLLEVPSEDGVADATPKKKVRGANES